MDTYHQVLDILGIALDNGIAISLKEGQLEVTLSHGKEINTAILDEIKKSKAEIIEFLQQEASELAAGTTVAEIVPVNRAIESFIPLSSNQEGLWFIDRYVGSRHFHLPYVERFDNNLQPEILAYAINYVINRHESLRTVIEVKNGRTGQRALAKDLWQMEQREMAASSDTALLEELVTAFVSQPFDLQSEHPIRACLIKMEDAGFLLVMVVHHIAADDWSMKILTREVSMIYQSLLAGSEVKLPPLPIQYADYACWQREQSEAPAFAEKLAYWEEKLQGFSPLNMPLDFARPAVQSTNGDSVDFEMDTIFYQQLQAHCRRQKTTPFIWLLTALKVLLQKYTGQNDLCIGVPVANRSQTSLEGLIGFFVNTIAVRSQLNPDLSFNEFLADVKQTTVEGFKYKEVPFDKVVSKVIRKRDLSRHPVFQILFSMQSAESNGKEDLVSEKITEQADTTGGLNQFQPAKMDLSLNVFEYQAKLKFTMGFCSDLFSKESITRLCRNFQHLLCTLLERETITLKTLDWPPSWEREELLEQFNQTDVYIEDQQNIVKSIEQQFTARANEPALVMNGEDWTYAQLADRVHSLANYFIEERGMKEGDTLVLHLERGPWSIAALLAAMKAGAVYVPVDPAYPMERIDFIRQDVNAKLVFDEVELDRFRGIQDQFGSQAPKVSLGDDRLVYIIYTSGSTGQPKGVPITHGNLLNYLLWAKQAYQGDREQFHFPYFTPLSFDLTQTSILLTLITGGQLFIEEEGDKIEALKRILQTPSLNTVKLTPAHIALLDTLEPTHIDHFIVGGEALRWRHVQKLRNLNPNCRIFNEYGPTEATIGCCVFEIGELEEGAMIPIGQPIQNTKLYVVDENNALVPIGGVGELCIAGAGVSKGYVNRPMLNAKSFVHNPFDPDENRMYKTGDIVRWLPDGNLVYLGRRDNQVKFRAYRIELGEIESRLGLHEHILQSVVLVKTDELGQQQLVAYIVPDPLFDRTQLKADLATALPTYMIPNRIVELQQLPLTRQGKIDRKALQNRPLQVVERPSYQAPTNAYEEQLVDIWQELLQVKRIGVEDDFFDLGGHSLTANQLVLTIKQRLGKELLIRDLFAAPTIKSLAEVIGENPIVERDAGLSAVSDLPDQVPLSYTQEFLWFIDKYQGSTHYHIPLVKFLGAELEEAVLQAAFTKLIERHQTLRTIIKEDQQGVPFQMVRNEPDWTIEIENLHDDFSGDQLSSLVQTDFQTPFNLAEDLPIRVKLYQLGAEGYLMVLVMHHIAVDAWSMNIIAAELLELYHAHLDQRSPHLRALPLNYTDYAIWQRNTLTPERLQDRLDFWKNKLQACQSLELPLDFPRPKTLSTQGRIETFSLDPNLSSRISRCCREEKVTLYMLLLATFKVLLYRYTGQKDICVSSPVANRRDRQLENIVGCFINTVIVRTQIDPKQTFRALLKEIKRETIERFEFEDTPVDQVVNLLLEKRDLAEIPFMRVAFSVQNTKEAFLPPTKLPFTQVSEKTAEAFSISSFDSTYQFAKSELNIIAEENQGQLLLHIEYSTDLFKPATIATLVRHFQFLLDDIIKEPGQILNQLNLLSEADRYQLLETFNATAKETKSFTGMADILAKVASLTPSKTAIVEGNKHISYAELLQRVNEVANYLSINGLDKEERVGIYMHRSIEAIISILAVIRAGGAYVPMDPEHPATRIAFIVEDAGISKVLTHQPNEDKLLLDDIQVLDIQQVMAVAEGIGEIEAEATKPQQLIYVLYTSGSTGQPKGVMIEHQAQVNMSLSQIDIFGITAEDRILQFAALTFDASVSEIFMALYAGATLVLPDQKVIMDTQRFVQCMQEEKISVVTLPPSYLRALDHTLFPWLRVLITAGEAAHPLDANFYAQSCQYFNAYGPTECTVCVSVYQLPADAASAHNIPIGKPIANTKVYVLDEELQLCPAGVWGELYVSGAGLARGYINRDQLSKETFLANPFEMAGRIYKTGDIVRWLPDGNLEFQARKDDQIKLRGYRIEPAEIVHALEAINGIKQAVVLLDDSHGLLQQKLGAFVVAENEISKAFISDSLKDSLPSYLIPAAIHLIDAIPLNSHGKIDQPTLWQWASTTSASDENRLPEKELSKQLLAFWQSLLKVEQIGLQDDFFELGGHSLLATQLVAMIRNQLSIQAEVEDVFEATTIEELTERLENRARFSQQPIVVKIEDKPARIPLSYAQESIWFIDQHLGSSHYHLPHVTAFSPDLNVSALVAAIKAVVDRHEALRTVYRADGGMPYQVVLSKNTWSMQLKEVAAQEVKGLVHELTVEQFNRPFILQEEHPIRAMLIKVDDEGYILLMVIHHIAADAWSMNIIIREILEEFYARSSGQQVTIESPKVQYTDYALWQRRVLGEPELAVGLSFWSEVLQGYSQLNFPLDYPRPEIQSTEGAIIRFEIDTEKTISIKRLCQSEGVTPFMFLLAVFKVLLYKYAGQKDICIGTSVANRGQEQTRDVVGLFVNTIALRTAVDDKASFRDYLAVIKEMCLNAFAHQEVPIDKVVDQLGIQRDLSRNPIFQILFSMQNAIEPLDAGKNDYVSALPEKDLAEFGLNGVGDNYHYSKMDLTFNVVEIAEAFSFNIEYCTDLFTIQRISAIAQHFEQLLDAAIQDMEQPLGGMQMLSQEEETELVQAFNNTQKSFASLPTVLEQFRTQVQLAPHIIAVEEGNVTYTYQELEDLSNQLAHFLLELGVIHRGDFVVLELDRCAWAVIALLAIMKTGAAFVPVPSSFPQERKTFIEQDTQSQVVLDVQLINRFRAEMHNYRTAAPKVNVTENHTVYAIYTSGSTGYPKGVPVKQKHLVNYLNWAGLTYRCTEEPFCFPFFTPLSFDLTQTSIFLSLLSGGKLLIFPEAEMIDVLNGIMGRKEINSLKLTPAHVSLLPGLPPNISCVIVGGEELMVSHVERLRLFNPTVKIFNEYGPTETTIGCCYYEVKELETLPTIPIGQPIANTQIYLLDENACLVPVGVIGELCIGGQGVAGPYLNRQELNDIKFVPNPYQDQEGQVVYRTGDLARWLPNGVLEFLGRKDDQVKIRGFRIELGEVTAVLNACAMVEQALVSVYTDSMQNRVLVAHLVPKRGAFDRGTIEKELRTTLPPYMLPSVYIPMEAFPLTRNGKVDRAALPKPNSNQLLIKEYCPPRTEVERKLVEIWEELLQLESISIYDHFFEIGGHSLLANRLLAIIESVFLTELQIRDLFASGTIEHLAKLIGNTQRKAVLAEPPKPLADKPERIPLSYSQEFLWFIDRYMGSKPYHLPFVLQFNHELKIGALEAALETLIERHEVLRTAFTEEDGIPYQVILSAADWQIDYLSLAEEGIESNMQDLAEELIGRPFDLTNDFPVRVTICKVADKGFLLILVIHHIATDLASLHILQAELLELYEAITENRPSQLLPVELQYADYAIWQKKSLGPQVLEDKLAFWEERLKGVSTLNLPLDFPRPSLQSTSGKLMQGKLSRALSNKLKWIAKEEKVTLYMLLLAAFKALLYRYSGQTDICVGTPVANRRESAIADMVGCFVNTIPIRTQFDADTPFHTFLALVKDLCISSFEQQDTPIDRVVSRIVGRRDPSRNPLYQVLFSVNTPIEAPDQDMSEYSLLKTQTNLFNFSEQSEAWQFAQMDITMSVLEVPNTDELEIELGYCTDLFREETMEHLLSHYEQLLWAIIDNRECPLSELNLLSSAEYQRLNSFNETALSYPQDRCITSLLEEVVDSRPDQPALHFEDQSLSYGALNALSNQLANQLIELGLEPGTVVGVLMKRSPSLLIGMLGVLKAGCAYLPMDIGHPDSRLAHMIEDSEIQYTLVDPTTHSRTDLFANLQPILVTQELLATYDAANIAYSTPSSSLAYRIYTSGSTGKPKGVDITHRNIVNFIYGVDQRLGQLDFERLLCLTTISFDIFVLESLFPLLTGKQIVLAGEQAQKDVSSLLTLVGNREVDLIQMTPSHLKFWLLDHRAPQVLSQVGALLIGGEPFPPDLLIALQKFYRGKVFNMYGPTETTVWSSMQDLTGADRVDIGCPIANTRIYIMNQGEQLQPVGVSGEICIGGDGVARGYWNRRNLTHKRFIPDPFVPGQVIYKTGDIGRWLPDGSLDCLGRIDNQVKISGFRIELGEIESRLTKYPGIQDAVVAVVEQEEEKILVTYFVTENQLLVQEIKSYLADFLPYYMIPRHFVQLPTLPLTPNGKVDRTALPAPHADVLDQQVFQTARDEIEVYLVALWKDLLKLDSVSIFDDFFHVGGHSLLATRVSAAIRKQFQVELNIRDLFTATTIEQIADLIRHSQKSDAPMGINKVAVRPDEIPLSYFQKSLWFIDRHTGSTHYHLPHIKGFGPELDVQGLAYAIGAVIDRHEALRTIIKEREGIPYQAILPEGAWNMQQELISDTIDRQQLEELIAAELDRPFYLYQEHPIRATLFKIGSSGYVLALVVHHITADAWAMDIIIREILAFHRAWQQQREVDLPALSIQYADYAIWQEEQLQNGQVDQKIDYWEHYLHDYTPLELPLDYVRPKLQSMRGKHIEFEIETGLTANLSALCQSNGFTPYMLLLAAFKVLLHNYSGQSDICIGTTVANRGFKELEGIVGLFVNTIPIRSKLVGNPRFVDFTHLLKDNILQCYDYQDIPFDQLVDRLQGQRDLSKNPIFQVLFTMQSAMTEIEAPASTPLLMAAKDLADFKFNGLGNMYNYSKMDLTLNAIERDNKWCFSLEYCTDLFHQATALRLCDHYQQLLTCLAADIRQPIGSIEMITPAERVTLLDTFNDTEVDLGRPGSVIKQFRKQLRRTPTAIAVQCQDKVLSYEQLEWLSNQFTYFLLSKVSLKKKDHIAIALERSHWTIVAVLATLKTGAAYVPLAPDLPEERKRFIHQDTHYKLCIDQHLVAEFEDKLDQFPSSTPSIKVDGRNKAYVIYTSGSTGRPKGVPIKHSQLINYLLWAASTYKKGSSVFHFPYCTPLSFDLTQTSIFLPLLSGGTVFVAEEQENIGEVLTQAVQNSYINTIKLTPAHLQLLEYLPGHIQSLIIGGEELLAAQVQRLRNLNPRVSIFNEYGPTEATVGCCVYKVPLDFDQATVPIGKPIANTQIYILDAYNKPMPVGVPGEICIGGRGVGSHYLKRRTLSREKFIASPFVQSSATKIYRTGDLAKWMPDGNIAFLGRRDDQVKVRGYRIELGEVMAVLGQCPLVTQSVVLVKTNEHGDKTLAAFVATTSANAGEAIREFLKSRLPDYMVPTLIVPLKELPLTANGKIDRESLLKRDIGSLLENPNATPRNELEERLCTIWMQTLNLEKVGIYQNFFDLGGHSLLAIRLVAQINQVFSTNLHITSLFDHPTIASFATILQDCIKAVHPLLVKLSAGTDQPYLFCAPTDAGLALTYAELAEVLEDQLTLYCFEPPGKDGISAVVSSIEDRAAIYIEEMQKIDPIGPYYLGGYSFGARVAYEIARQLENNGFEVAQLFIFDAIAPHHYVLPASKTFEERLIEFANSCIVGAVNDPTEKSNLTVDLLAGKTRSEQFELVHWELQPYLPELTLLNVIGFSSVWIDNLSIDYTPQMDKPLETSITVFTADTDFHYCWEGLTNAELMVQYIGGTHNKFLSRENASKIAVRLLEYFSFSNSSQG